MKVLKETFKTLGLSEQCYRVYLCLLEQGSSTARFVAESLSIPRPSVYDALHVLMQKGLVTERTQDNKKHFQIDDVRNIPRLVEDQIQILSQDKYELDQILPKLLQQTVSTQPTIKFYSGAEGVRQVLADMLWHSNTETFSMWPVHEMVELLGVDYFKRLHQRRVARGISVRVLWSAKEKIDWEQLPFLEVGEESLREARMAPKDMQWSMSYWAYADKVAFIASRQETFGFVIQSRDFVTLMQTQFETIWQLSKPVKRKGVSHKKSP